MWPTPPTDRADPGDAEAKQDLESNGASAAAEHLERHTDRRLRLPEAHPGDPDGAKRPIDRSPAPPTPAPVTSSPCKASWTMVPDAGPGLGACPGSEHDRLRHAEHVMGTVFSFDVPGLAAAALPGVLRWLHWVDATFSTYREDSDVSRYGRDEVALGGCAPELGQVLALCAEVSSATGGYFTIRPGGRFDPSGCQGLGDRARGGHAARAGSRDLSVNGGGDVQCAGEAAPGRAGASASRTHSVRCAGHRGYGERHRNRHVRHRRAGYHIINPHTGRAASHWPALRSSGSI